MARILMTRVGQCHVTIVQRGPGGGWAWASAVDIASEDEDDAILLGYGRVDTIHEALTGAVEAASPTEE